MAKFAVEISQVANQLSLTLLGRLFREPGIDQGVCLIVVEPVVRAPVERHEQEGPGLFGPHGRQHLLDCHELTLALRGLAKDRVGLQQQSIEFAAHDVGVERQTAVFLQHLGSHAPVFCGPRSGPMPTQCVMKPVEEFAVVQSGVITWGLGIQFDHLILPGLDLQQRDAHPVVDRDQNLLVAGGGVCDDFGLNSRKTPFRDTNPVALDQPGGIRGADRDRLGIRTRNPLKITHGLVGQIGVVVALLAILYAREQVVLGQALLDPVDFALRRVYEQVVVQQRTSGCHQPPIHLSGLDKNRCKVLEQRLVVAPPAGQFAIQLFGHGLVAGRVDHHVPAHDVAVLDLGQGG